MLSKHVDSTTLAPLRTDFARRHLNTRSGDRQGEPQRKKTANWLISFVSFVWFFWFNETNQITQTDPIDQMDWTCSAVSPTHSFAASLWRNSSPYTKSATEMKNNTFA